MKEVTEYLTRQHDLIKARGYASLELEQYESAQKDLFLSNSFAVAISILKGGNKSGS